MRCFVFVSFSRSLCSFSSAPAAWAPPPAPAAPPAWDPPAAPAAPAAPVAPAAGAGAAAAGAGNPSPFGGQSLDYTGGDDPNSANYGRLADKLQEADTERRKAAEEADARERAQEIRREERLKKIQYMQDMPDSQPAGTGKSYSRLSPTRQMSREEDKTCRCSVSFLFPSRS